MGEWGTRVAGTVLAGVMVMTPAAAWASEGAPNANVFGLVVTALIVIAAGVGAWVSIHERQRDAQDRGPSR